MPEGVGVACDDDAVLRLGDEVEGVVGEEVGRDAVNDGGDLSPEAVVGAMERLFHRDRYLLVSGLALMTPDDPASYLPG